MSESVRETVEQVEQYAEMASQLGVVGRSRVARVSGPSVQTLEEIHGFYSGLVRACREFRQFLEGEISREQLWWTVDAFEGDHRRFGEGLRFGVEGFITLYDKEVSGE